MPNRLKIVACAAAAAGIAVAGLASAAGQPLSRAEQSIKYREGLYQAIVWNFGPMSAAVQGKAPYDKDAFAKQAARVAVLTPMLAEGFAVESAIKGKSEAKPEIWQNKAEFDKLMQDLVTKSAALAEVAKTGDMAKIKPAFGETGQACKACHDKFKMD
jgi:cytochrome c556